MANGSEERRQQGVEDGWICVGTLGGPHGVRGDMRLKSFTEDPEAIFAFKDLRKGPSGPRVVLKRLRTDKEGFIARMDGVQNRDDAQALKGAKLYVPRDAFADEDEDEFYLADLIALDARDAAGNSLGFVRAVENFGAEDLLEVVLKTPLPGLGRFAFIPFRKAFVPVVDVGAGYVEIAFEDWVAAQMSERDGADGTGAAEEGDA